MQVLKVGLETKKLGLELQVLGLEVGDEVSALLELKVEMFELGLGLELG